MTQKEIQNIVSGMRPTGMLHLGHYHGVIANWVKLQNDPKFQNKYFFVADLHSLTTEYENTKVVQESIREILIDWLAFGVDPQKATIFIQSKVPQHAELHLLLSMITPVAWLERVPSYKDLQTELTHKDLSTYGFLGYPLLQTADVALYDGTHVPVGQDQVPHIELSREIVRRFNFLFKTDLLKEPQPILTATPKLPGIDGRKMSKSYDNSIYLSDSAEAAAKKIMTAKTDPARVKRTDPGDPNKCLIYDYHKIYSTEQIQEEVIIGCTTAGIGCIDCKKKLLTGMNAAFEPMRQKRQEIAKQPKVIDDILAQGNQKAHEVASENLTAIKEIFGI